MTNPMNIRLVLRFSSGTLAGQQVPINKSEIRIGSDSHLNDLAISDPSLMPEHARIVVDNDRYIIQRRDTQSLLIVNFQPVEYAILQDSDQVTLGQPGLSFTAQIGPGAPLAPPVQPSPIAQPTPIAPFSASEQFPSVDEARFRGPTQTSPQFAFPGAVPPQQQGAGAQMAPQVQMPFDQMPQMLLPQATVQAPYIETTRYLCAAAHLDEKFRRYVLRTIIGEEHRAIGETYGVDIVPVLKVSYAAQQRTFIRDCILFVILALLIITTGFSIISALGAMHAATTALPSITTSPFAPNPYANLLSSFLTTTFSIAAVIFLFFYSLGVLIVSLLARLFSSRIRPATIFLLVFLVFYWYAIPFFLASWIVVAIERTMRFYGIDARRLKKNVFNPGSLPHPLNPQVEQKARAVFQPQDGNVVVYSGPSPFAGAGIRLGGKSFSIDITKSEAGTILKPKAFQLDEIYTAVADALKDLNLEGSSQLCGTVQFGDKLYVNGQDIRNDMRFLPEPFARPYNTIDERLIEQLMLNPTQSIRYYKCIRLTSWKEEVILSIFYRFVMIANSLYVEIDYLLLPPLKESYHEIDLFESTFTIQKVWNIARDAFSSTAELWLSSPAKVYKHLFATQIQGQELKRDGLWIKDNPGFDYGSRTSLREMASDDHYHRYFQYLDKEMAVKLIENQLLESVVAFLDSRNIDTADFKRRLNTGSNDSFADSNLIGDTQKRANAIHVNSTKGMPVAIA